ncbi:hypothetical protein [Plantactinospora sp. GCM10030261]|uniref:hypothetical protein n=1 Tax=Plantactinospora sp. GCM10030261 TaxID=3273420 RepID=UPI003616076E
MIDMFLDWLRSLWRAARRVTPTPVYIRAGAFLAALAGLVFAVPGEYLAGRPMPLLVGIAVLPAVSPRRFGATVAILAAVAGWLLATTVFERPIDLWRLLGLAVTLYLVHSLCALAALVPYDAVVDPAVIGRWLGRAALVALAAAAVGVAALLAAGQVDSGAALGVTVLGLAVSAGLAALLGWLVRRA